MVPAPALLWLTGGLLFPAAAAAGFLPLPAAAVAALALAIALAAGADAWLSRHRLRAIRAALPAEVHAFRGRPQELPLRLESPFALPRLRAGLAWPAAITADEELWLALAAGAQEQAWPFTPVQRGEHRLDAVYLETRSSLGLWDLRRRVETTCVLRVYPGLRHSGALVALARQGGPQPRRQVGKGREFEKLREYVPGDSLDEIHWKATARRRHPITKVFQIERTQEVYLVVDASRLSARLIDGIPALDHALEAALVTGLAAERQGDLFGLAAFSSRLHGFVRARNGKAHYAACREAIYRLEPQPGPADFDELFTFLETRLRRRALIIVLTALDDPALAESFTRASRLLARRHLVVAGMLEPPGAAPLLTRDAADPGEVYQQLGGHLAWRSLRALELELERHGVRFRQFKPREFAAGLVALYGDIKRRQLL